MILYLTQNYVSILIGTALLGVVVWIIVGMFKKKKNGGSCGCGCEGCSSECGSHK